ncbi:hypothetical protein [Paenibacillus sp. FSL L8-0709]|uniref:hypothetical protein n=1 Tax=Paenibacillus sp. FSL L8-0709 TaxID=2975312 RepID=UPI0030F9B980
MKKRQYKKNQKKYIPVIADEFNLMLMTDEEREQAWKGYEECLGSTGGNANE